MKIKTLPNVLSLHLKRFKYQEELGRYVKLNYRVTFPFQLRLFNTSDDSEDPDRLYELFAIVVHVGGSVVSSDVRPPFESMRLTRFFLSADSIAALTRVTTLQSPRLGPGG